MNNVYISIIIDMSKRPNRSKKQYKLRSLVDDPKISSSDKGWIKQEINSIKQDKNNPRFIFWRMFKK